MNLDKANKRLSKKINKGFQGYPSVTIAYYGPNDKLATKVVLGYIAEENAEAQIETFITKTDIREDITVQTAIIKIIERSGAKSVCLTEGVSRQ